MKQVRRFLKKFTTKTLVFVAGLLLVLALLEIVLAVTGVFSRQEKISVSALTTGKKNILCLGDSYTQGMGSTHGNEYPTQLQHILDSLYPGEYAVHNAGQSSRNTSMMLAHLRDLMKRLKPDAILFLGGGANYWNYTGYQEGRLNSCMLSRLRIYKLAQLIYNNVRDKNTALDARIPFSKEKYDQLRYQYPELPRDSSFDVRKIHYIESQYGELITFYSKSFDTYYEKRKKDYHNYEGNAYVHILKKEYTRATELLRIALEQHPGDSFFYLLLSISEEKAGNTHGATDACKRWIETGENKEWALHRLASVFHNTGQKDSASYYFDKLRAGGTPGAALLLRNQNAGISDDQHHHPDSLSLSEIYKYIPLYDWVKRLVYINEELLYAGVPGSDSWVCSDLQKLSEICNDHQIPLLLLNYPVGSYDSRGFIALQANKVIRECTLPQEVIRIDLASAFSRLPISQNLYFAADGHCNDQGYSIMARIIYKDGLSGILSKNH
jgi:hypothetical protein